ncbi:MAG: hypothetical protein ICV70_07850 [Jiangellaceae bacterium]|nr:hypothetical protein [Jiangellaceae bacterium]
MTMALCGQWEHDGSCRWPHHTVVEHSPEGALTVRTLFACDAAEEQPVREQILSAFRTGRLEGPLGLTTWTLVREAASTIAADERLIATRLVRNGLE